MIFHFLMIFLLLLLHTFLHAVETPPPQQSFTLCDSTGELVFFNAFSRGLRSVETRNGSDTVLSPFSTRKHLQNMNNHNRPSPVSWIASASGDKFPIQMDLNHPLWQTFLESGSLSPTQFFRMFFSPPMYFHNPTPWQSRESGSAR